MKKITLFLLLLILPFSVSAFSLNVDFGEEVLVLEVNNDTIIDNIKLLLNVEYGYPVENQQLFFEETELTGSNTLESYGIISNTTINALVVHDHEFREWTLVVPYSCTVNGVRERICNICGYKESEIVAADPSKFSNWEVRKAATCTLSGTEERICSINSEKETRVILPNTGQISVWQVTPLEHYQICNLNNEKINVSSHKDDNHDNLCDICNSKIDNEGPTINVSYLSKDNMMVIILTSMENFTVEDESYVKVSDKEYQKFVEEDITEQIVVKDIYGNSKTYKIETKLKNLNTPNVEEPKSNTLLIFTIIIVIVVVGVVGYGIYATIKKRKQLRTNTDIDVEGDDKDESI